MSHLPNHMSLHLNNVSSSQDNIGSDENSPHHFGQISRPGSFQQLHFKPVDATRNSSLRALSINDTNSLRPRGVNYVPSGKGSKHELKNSVVQILKSDPNRTDFRTLAEPLTNLQRNISTVKSTSSIPRAFLAELEDADSESLIIGEYENDDDNVESEVGENGLLTDILQISGSSPLLNAATGAGISISHDLLSDGFVDDPRLSLLNPYEQYVKVKPPSLGKPLAPNGTPLDLSSVEETPVAFPLANYDHSPYSEDESKLYAVLDYELRLNGGKLNYDYSFQNDELFNYGDSKGGLKNIIKDAFHRLFKLGEHSEEEKYYKNYPWARILNRSELGLEAKDEYDHKTANDKTTHQFERNNTEMFPTLPSPFQPEEYDESTKQIVAFVPSAVKH